MGKTWVLDTDTKGTGANMVPIEKVEERAEAQPRRRPRPARRVPEPAPVPERRPTRRPARPAERTATALPPGHVRKKATGELGRLLSVDAKAGTAVVHWLKRGDTSTVPVSAITRR